MLGLPLIRETSIAPIRWCVARLFVVDPDRLRRPAHKTKALFMLFMLGLSGATSATPKSTSVTPTTTISINEFSRDRTLFDSGAAVGRNLATIPLSGQATAGEEVEVRLLPEGEAPTSWSSLGVADAAGNWSGDVSSARRAGWVRVEVRVRSEPFVRAMTKMRLGVGHVIALWGQSEIVRLHAQTHDDLTPETVLDDNSVQAMWMDGGQPIVHHITDDAPHSSALASFANTLIEERPGEKFALVFQAVSGTGIRQLVDDSDTNRIWAEDAALHAFATADGQSVGLPAMSWFASPGALAEFYDDAFMPLFTGKMVDGTDVTFPATITYGNGASFQADHWFGELYDMADTRWVAYGPHRFDITEPMQSATEVASGGTQQNLSNKEAARRAWRAMLTNPHAAGHFLPLGLEPLTYVNGREDGAGGWTDISHPAGDTPDGAPLLARLTAHAILQAAGLSGWSVPEFDQSFWSPDGAYAEFWSSQGSITTIRQARAEAALGSRFAHWTEVFGWQINGLPAERAEIVNGRVRLYPNNVNFVHTDVVNYGEGSATGMIAFPDDALAGVYKDLPVVDLNAHGVDGIPVRPLPEAAVLANTLPAGSPEFTTSATGPRFVDTQQIGAGVDAMQFRFDLAINLPPSGARTLMTTTGNYLKLEVLPSGALRIRVRDAGGIVHVSNVQSSTGVISDGVAHEVVLAVDLPGGYARLWVDDALVIDESFVSATPEIPGNRTLLLLATNSGSAQVEATITAITIWKVATPDGADPVGAPYKALTGPAAAVNSDPWKNGDDAT